MRSFDLEYWDAGRLTVNRPFADVLRAHGLNSFDAIWHDLDGETAKNVVPERTTVRIELSEVRSDLLQRVHRPAETGHYQLYIKRHAAPPWKEYVKPWLRLTRPILGARNEWEAILKFHALGIPTMTPVALGESGQRSFLITEALLDCTKLSHWMEEYINGVRAQNGDVPSIIEQLAGIARTMHSAGLHHQDFYLTHLLLPNDYPQRPLYIIDLGRVQRRRKLAQRWIVKDLAQWNYSARMLPENNRRQFLERYLGRPLRPEDRALIRRIERKTDSIARHSRKNGL